MVRNEYIIRQNWNVELNEKSQGFAREIARWRKPGEKKRRLQKGSHSIEPYRLVSPEAMFRSLRTDFEQYRCVTETRTIYRIASAERRRLVVYFTLHAARVKMSVFENSPTSPQHSQSENFELHARLRNFTIFSKRSRTNEINFLVCFYDGWIKAYESL